MCLYILKYYTPRPSSTKTRIKTLLHINALSLIWASPRPSSTKTRIKTYIRVFKMPRHMLRDHPPLKQGLRPAFVFLDYAVNAFSETILH